MLNKKNILMLFCILICYRIYGQSNDINVKKYVIFTFEVTWKHSNLKNFYYWIAPQDSLETKVPFAISPLYIEGYTKGDLENCKKGNQIDIFSFLTSSDYVFDNNYKSDRTKLISLINDNKTQVQNYNKTWQESKFVVSINVYATPITGEFCNCLQHHERGWSFKGVIYLPVSSFDYDKSFWRSDGARNVKFVDYSFVAYSSHYPTYVHGNNNIRVKSNIVAN